MQLITLPTAAAAAAEGARRLRDAIIRTPSLRLGFATGGTMEPLYADLAQGGGPDLSATTTFNLDEYVGVAPGHHASYHYYMDQALFSRLANPPRAAHIPHGDTSDPEAEAARYEALIVEGGIDLQLLGLGQNGHIGFNEPGSDRASRTRVVTLTDCTRAANARFFDKPADVPHQAISMGVATILEARSCVMLVTGPAKARALRALIHGPISGDFPAAFLREHPDTTVIADADAAALV